MDALTMDFVGSHTNLSNDDLRTPTNASVGAGVPARGRPP